MGDSNIIIKSISPSKTLSPLSIGERGNVEDKGVRQIEPVGDKATKTTSFSLRSNTPPEMTAAAVAQEENLKTKLA